MSTPEDFGTGGNDIDPTSDSGAAGLSFGVVLLFMILWIGLLIFITKWIAERVNLDWHVVFVMQLLMPGFASAALLVCAILRIDIGALFNRLPHTRSDTQPLMNRTS